MTLDEYAKTIFELAEAKPNIEEEFKLLIDAIIENKDAIKIFSSPRITNGEKKKINEEITKGLDRTLVNFLNVLIDNNRFGDILEIYNSFSNLILKKNNIQQVDIISSVKLSDKELNILIEQLETKLTGKKIIINNKIQKSLIGGIQVIYDGEIIDLSTTNKISQLKYSTL